VAPEPDPELSVHRADGDFVLGARAFAVTDSLTLLYSHRHFHESARAEAHRAAVQDRPFAIVMAELVNLAEVNRDHGFAAGDEALQFVAGEIQRVAARWRGHGFRPSGRRFAVLVSGADQSAADEIARTLAGELRPGPAEVAIGAAAWRGGEDGEQVIARALSAVARPTARAA
jgi:diguanylate cyclase (GGDEF)-like protein